MAFNYCYGCGTEIKGGVTSCPACGRMVDAKALSAARTPGLADSYLSFEGRIGRQTFWLNYVLPLAVLQIMAGVADRVFLAHGLLTAAGLLMTLVPNLAGQVKRLHDRSKSGWLLLAAFVPLIGSLWLLVETGFLRGRSGDNAYGADPLGGTHAWGEV